jgi:hypothetical protein
MEIRKPNVEIRNNIEIQTGKSQTAEFAYSNFVFVSDSDIRFSDFMFSRRLSDSHSSLLHSHSFPLQTCTFPDRFVFIYL